LSLASGRRRARFGKTHGDRTRSNQAHALQQINNTTISSRQINFRIHIFDKWPATNAEAGPHEIHMNHVRHADIVFARFIGSAHSPSESATDRRWEQARSLPRKIDAASRVRTALLRRSQDAARPRNDCARRVAWSGKSPEATERPAGSNSPKSVLEHICGLTSCIAQCSFCAGRGRFPDNGAFILP
jgi:hypothetical protein